MIICKDCGGHRRVKGALCTACNGVGAVPTPERVARIAQLVSEIAEKQAELRHLRGPTIIIVE